MEWLAAWDRPMSTKDHRPPVAQWTVSADGKTASYKDDAVELLRSLPEGARLKIGAMPIMSDTAISANPHDQVNKDRELAPYLRVHPDDGRRGKTSFFALAHNRNLLFHELSFILVPTN